MSAKLGGSSGVSTVANCDLVDGARCNGRVDGRASTGRRRPRIRRGRGVGQQRAAAGRSHGCPVTLVVIIRSRGRRVIIGHSSPFVRAVRGLLRRGQTRFGGRAALSAVRGAGRGRGVGHALYVVGRGQGVRPIARQLSQDRNSDLVAVIL